MATCALFLILASYAVLFVVRWGPAIWGGAPPILPDGSPLGGDFAHFYAASVLAWAGNALAVYSPPALQEIIHQVNGVKPPYFFPYPPTFLLILLPMALFSYVPSLIIWLTISLLACLFVVYRIAPHPWTPWLALAFPGIYMNFLTGQNGFLSASLLGGGLLLIDRHPWAGGLLLGCLSYKPHLAVLVPLALVAGRRWEALGAASLAALTLILLSMVFLGTGAWQAFFTQISTPVSFLASGQDDWLRKMPSIFAAARLAGLSFPLALVLQGVVILAVAAGVAVSWYRGAEAPVRNALLIIGILLFSPHIFYYDLALLLLPIAWIGGDGFKRGWLRGEPWLLLFCFFMPVLILVLAEIRVNMRLGVLSLGTFFCFTLRRQLCHRSALSPTIIPGSHPQT
jgi:alpha-1,2-mannosyltransferase